MAIVIHHPEVTQFTPGVYRRYDGRLVVALHSALATEYDPPIRTVSFVDSVTGEFYSMPLASDIVDAWSDDVIPENEDMTPRFTAVGVQEEPAPVPPLFGVEDVVRIALQLTTATMDLNGWYMTAMHLADILDYLGTPESLRLGGVVRVSGNPDHPATVEDPPDEEDYHALAATVVADLSAEAGIEVT